MEIGNIGKDSLKLSAAQIGALLIGMISTMLLSRFRTLGEYGTYAQMYIIAGVITPILMMGIPGSVTYFIPRASDNLQKRQILSQTLISATFMGVITFAVILMFRNFIVSYFSNPMLGSLIVVVAIFPWSKTMNSALRNYLVIYNRTSLSFVISITHSLAILAAVVVIVSLRLEFSLYMVIFISIESVYALWVYFIAARISGGLKLYFSMKLMKRILIYSIPMALSVSINSLNSHIDELVIGRFLSTEDLAIYTNAARELPFRLIGISIAVALLPRFVLMVKEKKMKEAIVLWSESIKLSYVIMCFFASVLLVYAPEIIAILYSSKYLPGVTVFRIYGLIMLFSVTNFSIIIISLGKTKYILYTITGAILLNLVTSILMYKLLGFMGPAVATLISVLVMIISQLVISTRLSGLHFKELLPWKNIGATTVVNAGFGCAFAFIKEIVGLQNSIGQIFESIIFGFVWMVLYFVFYFRYMRNKWDILNKGTI